MNGFGLGLAMLAVITVHDTRVMTDETVVFCRDLQEQSARLLFPPLEVTSVARADGSQTFENNIDYTIDAAGTITRLPGSRIPALDYYTNILDDTYYRFGDTNGRVFYSPGGVYKHQTYDVNVTYSYENHSMEEFYNGAWESKLTTVISKLTAKQTVNVVFFGDSITAGAQASISVFPFKQAYAKQLVEGLKQRFGCSQINYTNLAVGGKTSGWGVQEIQGVIDTSPDLVVLAFGMNDASGSVTTEQYKTNTEMMIRALRAANPDVSIVLVAEFSPNPDWALAHYDVRAQNQDALHDLYSTYANTAFVDVGAVSRPIAARKKFQDFSGNDINHPNDFLHWIYAELILHVFPLDNSVPRTRFSETNAVQLVHNSASTAYEGLEYISVKGPRGTDGAQYSIIQVPLGTNPVTTATLRLRTYTVPAPPMWGSKNDRAIQVMVLSGSNESFSESSATFFNQSTAAAWMNSSNTAAANIFVACDSAVCAASTQYNPSGPWIAGTWYDISLDTPTVAALEALRAAGYESALFCIQVQDDAYSTDPSGVRFYSDDSSYAPGLITHSN